MEALPGTQVGSVDRSRTAGLQDVLKATLHRSARLESPGAMYQRLFSVHSAKMASSTVVR